MMFNIVTCVLTTSIALSLIFNGVELTANHAEELVLEYRGQIFISCQYVKYGARVF